jgi:hypothetical protein
MGYIRITLFNHVLTVMNTKTVPCIFVNIKRLSKNAKTASPTTSATTVMD